MRRHHNVILLQIPIRSNAPRGYKKRLVVACLILVPISLVEFHRYGSELRQKLPVAALSEKDVLNLPAGNATAEAWSGCFQYNGHIVDGGAISGTSGGRMDLEERDGRLRIHNDPLMVAKAGTLSRVLGTET
jgi:hypothetical protein